MRDPIEYVTSQEVADTLGISVWTVYRRYPEQVAATIGKATKLYRRDWLEAVRDGVTSPLLDGHPLTEEGAA